MHRFWYKKIEAIKHRGENIGINVKTIARPLKYTMVDDIKRPGEKYPLSREKGIDVRLALDLVRLARYKQYDVAIIFSQDSDLREAVQEIRALSRELKQEFILECAFPCAPDRRPYGIRGTIWRVIGEKLYESCLDPNTDLYYPKPPMFKNT